MTGKGELVEPFEIGPKGKCMWKLLPGGKILANVEESQGEMFLRIHVLSPRAAQRKTVAFWTLGTVFDLKSKAADSVTALCYFRGQLLEHTTETNNGKGMDVKLVRHFPSRSRKDRKRGTFERGMNAFYLDDELISVQNRTGCSSIIGKIGKARSQKR